MTLVWLAALASSLLGAHGGGVAPPRDTVRARVEIRVEPVDWGGARVESIHALLTSAAQELEEYFPNGSVTPILVRPQTGSHAPIVLYKRSPVGEYIVELQARGRTWSRYVYQFSHELCHVLARYDAYRGEINKWFEETLCETAALFTLKRLSKTWEVAPPYESWRSYAPHLGSYADKILDAPAHQLPRGMALSEWIARSEAELRTRPTLRKKNATVAGELLPLFLEFPEHWKAIPYLNLGEASNSEFGFGEFLGNWRSSAPVSQRSLIDRVISKLRGGEGARARNSHPEALHPARELGAGAGAEGGSG